MIIYILVTSTGLYHLTVYFGQTICLVNPWAKKISKQQHAEFIHHTKELVAYQQPLVCWSGGKRKVKRRKPKSREGGQWGKGKSKRKDRQWELQDKTAHGNKYSLSNENSSFHCSVHPEQPLTSSGMNSQWAEILGFSVTQGLLSIGKTSSGTSRHQVCSRKMCRRPFC